ncbi:MAG: ASKHA domain-containing protein [Armatimonadota bacterium]
MSSVFDTASTITTDIPVEFLPDGRKVQVDAGTTILQAARQVGVQIDAPCGERGKCGKCRVKVASGMAGEPHPEEVALLSAEEMADGVRLACQAQIIAPLVVEVPETSRNLAHRKAAADLRRTIEPAPFTRKICVKVAEPSLEKADFRDDLSRLRAEIPELAGADLEAVRGLHHTLLEGKYGVTAVLAGDRLIAVEPGNTTRTHYGVALDIGTTTLVGYLIDLRTGNEVAVYSQPNPQATYGADVISRIQFSMGDQEKVETLRQVVTGAVNVILQKLAETAGIKTDYIYEMMVVGNTCMSHLFLGIDPLSLGHAPYTPVLTDSMTMWASGLGLDMHPRARVRTLPNIAGFVGADTVAVLAASELDKRKGLHVAVDIGTNCEVLVGMNGRVIACSTAAGPAFEGAKISQGMRAQPGAIDGIVIGSDLYVHTIGDTPPLGLCGSGVVDAIGELRRVEMLDSTGRFADPDDLTHLPEVLRDRLIDDGVILVYAKDSGTGRDIILTQQDVREIQLVKSAIYAGTATLLEKLGHSPEELDSLFIAGAFGTYISKEHAVAIGLIPNIPLSKLVFLGNAAGTGAKMAIISRHEYTAICDAARQVEDVELAGDLTFSNNFMMAMMLAPGCED